MLNLVLSLSLSHTGHWKFNMAPHGKELSEDLKKTIIALHKDGVGYKKIAKTLKLSCRMVAKTIQRFNRTGSTQNGPHHGRPKKLCARAQRHIQRLCLGNRRMSAASIAAEVEGVGGQPVSAQTIRRTLQSNWSAWFISCLLFQSLCYFYFLQQTFILLFTLPYFWEDFSSRWFGVWNAHRRLNLVCRVGVLSSFAEYSFGFVNVRCML